MKLQSHFRFGSVKTEKLWKRSRDTERSAVVCRRGTQISRSTFSRKGLLLALFFCIAHCATQAFLTARAFAEEATPPRVGAELTGITLMANESFALASLDYRSSQAEPGLGPSLLIGMIDHEASTATRRSGTVAAHSTDDNGHESVDFDTAMDRALRAIVLKRTPSLDSSDSLAGFFKRMPRYGFLSWTDLRSFARTPTYQVDGDHTVLHSGTLPEADARMSVDQAKTQFRPLAEIRMGSYNLPIVLSVPNSQNCCR